MGLGNEFIYIEGKGNIVVFEIFFCFFGSRGGKVFNLMFLYFDVFFLEVIMVFFDY